MLGHSDNIMKKLINIEKQYSNIDFLQLAKQIKTWGTELGFQQIGISDTELSDAENHLSTWLGLGFHGEMQYMQRHGVKRSRPADLQPGTVRIISARMDYLPPSAADPDAILNDSTRGYISRYALGRDYHKVLRNRLQKLAHRIEAITGKFGYRAFTDSAPVLEKALAEKAGLGWIGKHSNLIQQQTGSWFFLGELYTDLPLPADSATENHCGTCRACMDICPTGAIVAPYQVDARRCVSYLTIELKGSIPIELRPMMGNRIYGCDDCQIVCPWNRFARSTNEKDFTVRHNLDTPALLDLFNWSESEFLSKTEGMAIRRIGYDCWLRNIAVALGNALKSDKVKYDESTIGRILTCLKYRADNSSSLVREHALWAIQQYE